MITIPSLEKDKNKKENEEKPQIPKNASDLQRLKLEKLMKNPDKPVIIPERPREKGTPHVPDFVRNVMGSSAGAGSGEFHVYRHLRRKEYARQKYIQMKGERELLEEKYHQKIEENQRIAEERTAKKRAKRLKKKEKLKNKPKKKKTEIIPEEKSSEESESGNEDTEVENKVTRSPSKEIYEPEEEKKLNKTEIKKFPSIVIDESENKKSPSSKTNMLTSPPNELPEFINDSNYIKELAND